MKRTMEGNFGPKTISKRIKAKGLQKLKFYCESCEKQCRDENGFKCHTMSESHLHKMQLYGENPEKFVQGYSQKFENGFLEHLKRCHGFSRVAATVVYNEYISDRHHVHMNATKWVSLTEFVMYLGKTGKCKVENTEKGWFITYNTTDSEGLFHERMNSKRLKSKLMEEVKKEKEIAKQIERATSVAIPIPVLDPMEIEGGKKSKLQNDNHMVESDTIIGVNKKIVFGLCSFSASAGIKRKAESCRAVVFEDVENVDISLPKKKSVGGGERSSALDELIQEEEEARERRNRKPYWLCEGIVVKVTGKVWADKGYSNKKGVVKKVLDEYIGEIEFEMMLDTTCDRLVRIHQDDLQTVLPQIGGLIRIVNGSYRGFNARLLAVDTHNFCAKVKLDMSCVYQGRVLPQVAYDDICKIAV